MAYCILCFYLILFPLIPVMKYSLYFPLQKILLVSMILHHLFGLGRAKFTFQDAVLNFHHLMATFKNFVSNNASAVFGKVMSLKSTWSENHPDSFPHQDYIYAYVYFVCANIYANTSLKQLYNIMWNSDKY